MYSAFRTVLFLQISTGHNSSYLVSSIAYGFDNAFWRFQPNILLLVYVFYFITHYLRLIEVFMQIGNDVKSIFPLRGAVKKTLRVAFGRLLTQVPMYNPLTFYLSFTVS
jgi:hypothetical protein